MDNLTEREATKDSAGIVEQPEPKAGEVQWHCSDEDGGPDVGILVGLPDEALLWVGELLKVEGDCMGMVFYQGNTKVSTARLHEWEEVRELIEHQVAPTIASAAAHIEAQAVELGRKDKALRSIICEYERSREDAADVAYEMVRIAREGVNL